MKTFSNLWTVQMSDWQRGLVVAIITGPLGIIYDSVMAFLDSEGWQIKVDWKSVIKSAILGFMAYYGKNFITGKNGNILSNK